MSLVSPGAWLTANEAAGSQRIVHYCNKTERGVFSLDFQLGCVRDVTPADLSHLNERRAPRVSRRTAVP